MGQELLWEGILVKGPLWQTLHFTQPEAACSLTPLQHLGSGGQRQVSLAAPLCHLGVTLSLDTQQHSFHPGPWRDGAL